MVKENRWITSIIVLLLSLALLFGGWFLYQYLIVQKPADESINKIKGVSVTELKMDRGLLEVDVQFDQIDGFQNTYTKIEEELLPYSENKTLEIHVLNQGNEQLRRAWEKNYFSVAEAIDQQKYSQIPETLESMKVNYQLKEVAYSMDDRYIYIDLHQKEDSLYILLPRYNGLEVKEHG